MTNTISFLLVTYNNPEDTIRCIRSIQQQAQKTESLKIKIFVYDNSAVTAKYPQNITVFGSNENIGFAAACNYLSQKASALSDIFIFLNNDTQLMPNFLSNLKMFIPEILQRTALCPQIFNPDGSVWFSGGYVRKLITRPETSQKKIATRLSSQFLTGCCIIVSKQNWVKTKGFDEKYFLYYEDVDWSLRAADNLELFVEPKLELTHYAHSSSGGANGLTQTYFQTRNNLYLAKKQGHLALGLIYIAVLSVKRIINLITQSAPDKMSVIKMIILAWKDFIFSNYEQGSFIKK